MRWAFVACLALAVGCLAVPAHADSTYGSVSGVNGVLYDDCLHYPYHYAVDVPADAGYRDLEVSLVGPDGRQADTDYVAPSTNQATGTSTFFLCPPTDLYGGYTIRARVEWGADASSITDWSQLDDAHFSMRRPRTRTSLSVSTLRPAYGQVVTYRILARDERPGGYFGTPFAWVFLQKRVDGHWVRVRGSRTLTHSTGRVRLRLRYLHHHEPMRFRAVTAPSSRFSRSVSPSVRLW